MKKLIILFIFLLPNICLSQDVEEVDDGIRVIKLGKIEFGCFLHKDAFELLEMRIAVPKLKNKIVLLEKRISNRDFQLIKYEQNTVNLNYQKAVLIKQNKYLQQKIDNIDIWWKNPYLWLGLGVVLGTCTTITIVYGVRS